MGEASFRLKILKSGRMENGAGSACTRFALRMGRARRRRQRGAKSRCVVSHLDEYGTPGQPDPRHGRGERPKHKKNENEGYLRE